MVSNRSATVRLIDQKQEMVCVSFFVVTEVLLGKKNAVMKVLKMSIVVVCRLEWCRKARPFEWQTRLTLIWYAFCFI